MLLVLIMPIKAQSTYGSLWQLAESFPLQIFNSRNNLPWSGIILVYHALQRFFSSTSNVDLSTI